MLWTKPRLPVNMLAPTSRRCKQAHKLSSQVCGKLHKEHSTGKARCGRAAELTRAGHMGAAKLQMQGATKPRCINEGQKVLARLQQRDPRQRAADCLGSCLSTPRHERQILCAA